VRGAFPPEVNGWGVKKSYACNPSHAFVSRTDFALVMMMMIIIIIIPFFINVLMQQPKPNYRNNTSIDRKYMK
jgi:hypothetical protein